MKSTSVVVMEDRKRSVPHDPTEEISPPFKRQAIQSSSQPQNSSHQVPQSQEDVIHFQKEAIWRQMQEYKRERNVLEARLEELDKRSAYHDDHLRIMDAWWIQLLDEVKLISGEPDKGTYKNGESLNFPSSLLFDDVATFANHLEQKRDHITTSLNVLFKSLKSASSLKFDSDKIDELQARIRHLLVNEKVNKVEISRLEKEVEGASARLTEATVKYLTAEKKLDRLKSQTLAKIERQAMFNSSVQPEHQKDTEYRESAKDREIRAKVAEGHIADAEQARKEAQAIANKQKEEIQQLQNDNCRLSEQVTTFTIKFGRLCEDDITNSDSFKNLKIRLEDLATRYNHIEAVNRDLGERAEMLESERTIFKETILDEQAQAINEMQIQLTKTEQDLARIRSARDDLLQDQALRKAREEAKLSSIKEVNELSEARAMRIEALELEINRLKQLAELDAGTSSDIITTNLSVEELRRKYEHLDKAYKVLSQELPGLEQAFKKAHELGNKKVQGLQETEEKLKRLLAEKNKADQKYFTAMKAKDALQNETRSLKSQNSKSTEIITQLKEAEKRLRDLVCNLEKQIAELKSSNNAILMKNKELQSRNSEQSNTIDSLKSQISDLSNSLRQRDSALSRESFSRREAEIECERLHVKVDEVERAIETNRPQDSENGQLEALRQIALCAVCRNRFKNTAIKNCGHVFCRQCADERIASRSRKCPNCGRAFAATDLISVHL